MRYVSTRGRAPALSFGEAMLTGLARDGGLYVPETVPALEARDIAALAGLSYESAAFRVMRPFVSGSFSDEELRAAIASAFARATRSTADCKRTLLGDRLAASAVGNADNP